MTDQMLQIIAESHGNDIPSTWIDRLLEERRRLLEDLIDVMDEMDDPVWRQAFVDAREAIDFAEAALTG